jgi:hypothetical protein
VCEHLGPQQGWRTKGNMGLLPLIWLVASPEDRQAGAIAGAEGELGKAETPWEKKQGANSTPKSQ